MGEQDLFQERVVKVERPEHHFRLLAAANGQLLALNDAGALCLTDVADDQVVWDRAPGGFRHVATGKVFAARENGDVRLAGADSLSVRVCHGPEKLPSEYLAHLRREGWVCLACILPPDTVDDLQRAACTDAYEAPDFDKSVPRIALHPAVGRTVAEPISLALVRRYMGTEDVRVGHPPGFAVLAPDDGKRPVQGWHADFPYNAANTDREYQRTAAPMAVQRNVCISEFTKLRGATAFKLGSHTVDAYPPQHWNPQHDGQPYDRARHGLPYTGPEADVIEAPAGSVILYDARTWHRAGFNRSKHRRAAMLQAMLAGSVKPKTDTSNAYARFVECPFYGTLSARERREIQRLMGPPTVPTVEG